MNVGYFQEHWKDAGGAPAGGVTSGAGFAISWQNGPLGRCTCGARSPFAHDLSCGRRAPNGAFVEDVIAAARDRIIFYEQAGFPCEENKRAIDALNTALALLNARTARREAAGVEGTHTPDSPAGGGV